MSRTIKFRVWDTDRNKWVKWLTYNIDDFAQSNKEWHKVSQFTGLLDRYDKEIWEGDVVKGLLIYPEATTGTLPTMGVVEYKDGYSAFCLRNQASQTLFHNHLIHSFEVIGNIYEHPDYDIQLTPHPKTKS
jgi:uncharacterized phage protein (TIGR01671 family)